MSAGIQRAIAPCWRGCGARERWRCRVLCRAPDTSDAATAPELRMLRMEGAQVRIGLGGGGDLVEDRRRLAQLRAPVEIGTQLLRRIDDTAAPGIPGIFEDRDRQRDVGIGGRLGCQRRRRIGAQERLRHGEVARLEPPVAGTLQLGRDGGRLRRRAARRRDPKAAVLARLIKLGDRRSLRVLLVGSTEIERGDPRLDRKARGRAFRRRPGIAGRRG